MGVGRALMAWVLILSHPSRLEEARTGRKTWPPPESSLAESLPQEDGGQRVGGSRETECSTAFRAYAPCDGSHSGGHGGASVARGRLTAVSDRLCREPRFTTS